MCINVGGRGAAADNVKISLGLWTCGTNCLPDGILSLIKSRIGKLRQKSGSRFCTCISFIGYRFYRSILLSGCFYIYFCLLLVCEEKFGFDAALSHLFPTWLSKKKKKKERCITQHLAQTLRTGCYRELKSCLKACLAFDPLLSVIYHRGLFSALFLNRWNMRLGLSSISQAKWLSLTVLDTWTQNTYKLFV